MMRIQSQESRTRLPTPVFSTCATFEFHGTAKNKSGKALAKGGVFFELGSLIAAQMLSQGFDVSEPLYKGPVATIASNRNGVSWTILLEPLDFRGPLIIRLKTFPSRPATRAALPASHPPMAEWQNFCTLVDAQLRSNPAISNIQWIPPAKVT